MKHISEVGWLELLANVDDDGKANKQDWKIFLNVLLWFCMCRQGQ